MTKPSEERHICCKGILHRQTAGTHCCSKEPFFPRKQHCCSDKLYSKKKFGCCQGKPYLKAEQFCCGDRVIKELIKIKNPDNILIRMSHSE